VSDLSEFERSLEADVEDLADLIEAHTVPEDDETERLYDTVADWVTDWLSITIDRRISRASGSGVRWCPSWWAHPEGLNRIWLLWQAWETARVEGAMADWWAHFEAVWRELTGEDGPFRDCRPAGGGDAERHDAHTTDESDRLLPVTDVPLEVLRALPEGAPPND
jgi:hypothetical protein